jgi:hypothetical protein
MSKQKTTDKVNKRSKANTSVSTALLDSYRSALYSIKDFLDRAAKDLNNIDDIELQLKISKGIVDLGEKIGRNIESLDKLEDKVKREERDSAERRGGNETSLFEEPEL